MKHMLYIIHYLLHAVKDSAYLCSPIQTTLVPYALTLYCKSEVGRPQPFPPIRDFRVHQSQSLELNVKVASR